MERLKATVADELAKRIQTSKTSDLQLTCAALASHINKLAVLPHLLEQLVDPRVANSSKDDNAARNFKEEGNIAYGEGDFHKALFCYSKALRYSPWGPEANQKKAVATVLVNRATCLHKLCFLDAAQRDCKRAIDFFPSYAKAWYRRGLIRSDQGRYHEGIVDMEKALGLESSAGGRKQVEKQMEQIRTNLTTDKSSKNGAVGSNTYNEQGETGESAPSFAERTWTSDKGAGLQTTEDLAPGSVVFSEEPYAAIISKAHRDSHCHYCFRKLSVDAVACRGCAVGVYCSDTCRESAVIQGTGAFAFEGEHQHECGGASWSAVLPTQAVLAARVYMRSLSLDRTSDMTATSTRGVSDLAEIYSGYFLENMLCHHYDDLAASDKLDMLVLALVLAHCLQHSLCRKEEIAVEKMSVELVLIMARIRVNVMAINEVTSTSSIDGSAETDAFHSVDQVNIAHAVYLKGSMLNHSCDPNVHSYFSSRSLFVNSIKRIPAFTALELCYGAQMGELDRSARQKWLKERYFFTCACAACSTTKFSDLVINSLRCPQPGCSGMLVGLDGSNSLVPERTCGEFRCLGCLLMIDTTIYHRATEDNLRLLKRIEKHVSSKMSGVDFDFQLTKAVGCLDKLKRLVHPCNKQLAKAQDILAKILCAAGRPEAAISHCQDSIKILELLYGEQHIAVANERLKLASITMAAGDSSCAKNQLAEIQEIFCVHYGPDYTTRLPAVLKICSLLDQQPSIETKFPINMYP